MVSLEGLVIFILAGYAFWIIGFPIILDIIWIKRVKSGKSKIFGPFGIISIIVNIGSLLYMPAIVHHDMGIFRLGMN